MVSLAVEELMQAVEAEAARQEEVAVAAAVAAAGGGPGGRRGHGGGHRWRCRTDSGRRCRP